MRQVIRAACPPDSIDVPSVWPGPRTVYAQSYGQREAAALFGEDPRVWSTDTVGFADDGAGAVCAVQTKSVTSGEIDYPAQLVLIAKGFTGAEQAVLDAFAPYGNVYLAGDARMGSTLVATAIADGLAVAEQVAEKVLR